MTAAVRRKIAPAQVNRPRSNRFAQKCSPEKSVFGEDNRVKKLNVRFFRVGGN